MPGYIVSLGIDALRQVNVGDYILHNRNSDSFYDVYVPYEIVGDQISTKMFIIPTSIIDYNGLQEFYKNNPGSYDVVLNVSEIPKSEHHKYKTVRKCIAGTEKCWSSALKVGCTIYKPVLVHDGTDMYVPLAFEVYDIGDYIVSAVDVGTRMNKEPFNINNYNINWFIDIQACHRACTILANSNKEKEYSEQEKQVLQVMSKIQSHVENNLESIVASLPEASFANADDLCDALLVVLGYSL